MNPLESLNIPERIKKVISESYPLSAEQRVVLASLDSATTDSVEAAELMDIAGVLGGVKPAALLHGDIVDRESVVRLGLKTMGAYNGCFVASFDEELSATFVSVFNDQRTPEGELTDDAHRNIGAMLGYPETSTEYFIARAKSFDGPDQLPMVMPRSIRNTPTENVHQLILSPDNYKEELESYVLPLEKAMQEFAPHSYVLMEKERRHGRLRRQMGRKIRTLFTRKDKKSDTSIEYLYVD